MVDFGKNSVTWLTVGEEEAGQRIDNFLFKRLKGVPKTHVYRILRSGEVRVNSRRAEAAYRVAAGDRLRIPPVRTARPQRTERTPARPRLAPSVIYQDEALLVLDKPSGWAVHGGSGVSLGVVEQLRAEHPEWKFLELVHRLDRETSGVLLLARKRAALLELHRQLREGETEKVYLVLVKGRWRGNLRNVRLPLEKRLGAAGEKKVRVSEAGQAAHTVFRLQRAWREFSLLEAELRTGRTHQIRVHLSHLGYPIAGDDRYGDFDLNKALARQGLKRMFLHARRMVLRHPVSGERLALEAPLPADLQSFIQSLDAEAV
ncbi:MAG TPA: RluA family pseudouridine synthase [Burkholderiales bacterium]|nr:RluA family pseudouridine synthase [Burkholderiales bacterium]